MLTEIFRVSPRGDKNRIAFHGVSWGAHWGTEMAVVERARLRVVSVQVSTDRSFLHQRISHRIAARHREYFFDQALMVIFDNVHNVGEMADMFSKMGLVKIRQLSREFLEEAEFTV